jgi:hypothetical protein
LKNHDTIALKAEAQASGLDKGCKPEIMPLFDLKIVQARYEFPASCFT